MPIKTIDIKTRSGNNIKIEVIFENKTYTFKIYQFVNNSFKSLSTIKNITDYLKLLTSLKRTYAII